MKRKCEEENLSRKPKPDLSIYFDINRFNSLADVIVKSSLATSPSKTYPAMSKRDAIVEQIMFLYMITGDYGEILLRVKRIKQAVCMEKPTVASEYYEH
jgi:hypothetical protein